MFPVRYGRRNSVDQLFTCVSCEGFVGRDLVSGREQVFFARFALMQRVLARVFGVHGGCGTSPRPISTGRLDIAVVDLLPINPKFCGGPYQVCPVGNFILKCASRLDAFSGYHVRT